MPTRVSLLADQSAILMSLYCGNSHCTDRRTGCTTIFLKGKNFSLRIKGKFSSILLFLSVYLEGIYVPTIQQQAHLWQLNYCESLCFTQMCLCNFYFPLLLRLENDVETNPVDQRHFLFSPYVLVRARLRTNVRYRSFFF